MRIAVLAVLALFGAAPRARSAEILVHAAASLRESLEQIARAHSARTGDEVRLNLGASSGLARQLLEGAPGDVFFPADESKMDQVAEAGLVVPGTRRSVLANSLVVVVRSGSKLVLGTSADL